MDFKREKRRRRKEGKIISPVRESLSSVFTDNTNDILLLLKTHSPISLSGRTSIPRRNNSIRLTEDDDALRSRFVCIAGNEEHFSRKISRGRCVATNFNKYAFRSERVDIASRLEKHEANRADNSANSTESITVGKHLYPTIQLANCRV